MNTSAGEIQVSTGRAVMAMGGFTGSDNAPTLERLQALVASGDLRFVSVGGSQGGGGMPGITNRPRRRATRPVYGDA